MSSRRVVVVGGGITGLAAAHRLVELGREPILLERDSRPGGVILTEEVKRYLIEAGPDSFLARKPWAADLCRRLGMADEIIPTDPSRRGSFILFGGRLHPLPEGLTSLVPTRLGPIARSQLLTAGGKARLLLEPFVPRRSDPGDESLAGFFRRRIGEQASRRLVEPLVRGIYGGEAESLSLRATFPQLAEIERRYGSLIVGLLREARARTPRSSARTAEAGAPSPRRHDPAGQSTDPATQPAPGESAFLSLRRGMGSLVEGLRQSLPASSVRLASEATALRRSSCGAEDLTRAFQVQLAAGESLDADAVILATPASDTARLVAGLDSELSALVGAIQAGPSVTVALGFDRRLVGNPLQGYGFVVPEAVGGPLLACTWASSKFPGRTPKGCALVRAFLAQPESLLERDDREVTALAMDALRPILGLPGEPGLARVHRWKQALPRYAVGHPERLASIERRLAGIQGLYLAGAAYRGVGIPDCIRDGERAAEAAGAQLGALRA
jgi:oxygen-dependent protoporphyrinogen oxidase